LQEFLQFIKNWALYQGNIETRNRIGGTWRYSHTKQEETPQQLQGRTDKINGSKSVLSTVYKENDVIKYPALANTLRRFKKWKG
jgi:hypothetical protein